MVQPRDMYFTRSETVWPCKSTLRATRTWNSPKNVPRTEALEMTSESFLLPQVLRNQIT